MLIGVISFTFATGTLSSLMSNTDASAVRLQERMEILNKVYNEHKLPLSLYNKLR